jgi:predicted MFS family arabinose efflux permease
MGFMATLQFLGPAVAGVVVDARGLTAAFALEVALLAAAAAAFSGVRAPQPPPSGRHVLGDLADGLRYVAGQPRLRGLLALSTVPGVFFIGPFAVTLPLLVPDLFGASDKWVGLLWGCFGAGVFFGSLFLTFRPLPRRGLAVCLSNLLGGFVMMLYGRSDELAVAAALLVLWGLNASVFMNYVVTLLQEQSEPPMLGRVMSMYSLAFFLAMPLGYGLAGASTAALGSAATLLLNGAAAAAVGLLCLVGLRSVRELH